MRGSVICRIATPMCHKLKWHKNSPTVRKPRGTEWVSRGEWKKIRLATGKEICLAKGLTNYERTSYEWVYAYLKCIPKEFLRRVVSNKLWNFSWNFPSKLQKLGSKFQWTPDKGQRRGVTRATSWGQNWKKNSMTITSVVQYAQNCANPAEPTEPKKKDVWRISKKKERHFSYEFPENFLVKCQSQSYGGDPRRYYFYFHECAKMLTIFGLRIFCNFFMDRPHANPTKK